ncbi:MAG: ATP-binding protein [Bdellovibrionota bacterium]
MKVKNVHTPQIVTLFLGFVFSIGLYTYSLVFDFSKIDQAWIEYQELVSNKKHLISELKTQIGYGGMIHNFKNYLLRKEEVYKIAALENIKKAKEIIGEIEKIDSETVNSPELLSPLKSVINKYEVALDVITKLQPALPHEIDKIVIIDDTEAIKAFSLLQEKVLVERLNTRDKIFGLVSDSKLNVVFGVISSLLFFLVVIFWVNQKLSKALQVVSNQQEAQVNNARLSALGQMAGSVAHEINNPLAIIKARADALDRAVRRGDLTDEKLTKFTADIRRTVLRVSAIIKGLRSLTRNSAETSLKEVYVADLIDEVVALSYERYRLANVKLDILGVENQKIYVDKVQIGQVLINLLNNSYDEVSKTDDAWVKIEFWENSEKSFLSVSDSGNGIPEELVDRLMEPFFTTKNSDQGTGIGLSISKGIIDKHHGKFYYDSGSAHTRFVMELPKKTAFVKAS